MLDRIAGEHASGDQVRVSVVVLVLDHRRAVFRDASIHEFAHKTAEISRHHDRLKARYLLCIKSNVYEAQKVQKIGHGTSDVIG